MTPSNLRNQIHCPYCSKSFPKGETDVDHVIASAWYPTNVPVTFQRYTVRACCGCNGRLGKTEEDILHHLAGCLDPQNPAVRPIVDKLRRALDPSAARSAADRQKRETRRRNLQNDIFDASDVPRHKFAAWTLSNLEDRRPSRAIRVPSRFRISDDVSDPKVRQFCLRESEVFFKGALQAANVPIINPIGVGTYAAYKPVQLACAKKVGLAIPDTIMSNSSLDVLKFSRAAGHCIYKAFTAPSFRMTETRDLNEDDLTHLNKLRHSPVIVQGRITKQKDIRVNIFNDSLFAAEVAIKRQEAALDWRLDLSASWFSHTLPHNVGLKLFDLFEALGLHYGCVDLGQDQSGEYIFLEVNPAGQFLFIEIDTGQPLANAMARLLVEPPSRPSRSE